MEDELKVRQLSPGGGREKEGEERLYLSLAPVEAVFNSNVSTGTAGEQLM